MFCQRHGLKAADEKLSSHRMMAWWLWMSSAVVASFILLLMFIFVDSKEIQDIFAFAGTTFQWTFSTTKNHVPPYSYKPEYSITCNITTMGEICPANYPLSQQQNTSTQPTCPEYFRWIHEDLKPWMKQGITREMIEEVERKNFWRLRLVIVNGTAYVKTYGHEFHTRDTFTLWGILQLLKRYPGKLPDVDLILQMADKTSIMKDAYTDGKTPPPLFHYCGSNDAYDIVFPDRSFWGWPDTNIKPWVSLKKDLEEGNKMMKWTDRQPYAYWRGNLLMGDRKKLCECNSTTDWNTLIYNQDWKQEIREGFKNSDLSKQCKHKYKIYKEGNAWSVSRKYILACDSMTLLVTPFYYDFLTRGLVPTKHYWPVDPNNLCKSLKLAVDWGNKNPDKAQGIGREGSNFILNKITMQNVYDYIFHLLSEYGKLLRYKPTVPPGAVELCSNIWVCPRSDLEWVYKIESVEIGPSSENPCTLPPPFNETEINILKGEISKGFKKAKDWEENK